MIARYTRDIMGAHWAPAKRFEYMLKVEIAVAQVQAEQGIIPKSAALAIQNRGAYQVERIDEIEKVTRHDVIAFVTNVAENVGEEGRFVHYGLTSSDVLDTALSLRISEAGKIILGEMAQLLASLRSQAFKYSETLCAGRTHGMHAEPVTFGLKLMGYYFEFDRRMNRLMQALKQIHIGKLSGAVGTYSFLSKQVERAVCERLHLTPESLATQVIPRDRLAELFSAFAILAGGVERLSVELRHLQRTEMGEVYESFSKGQKGSSAMPHKKNPISAENLTGCARLLRSYVMPALENMALWHERDISHSSVERVILPDAFILTDYALSRLRQLIDNLDVQEDRMRENMNLSQGQLFSSHVLLALISKGLSRTDAYELVQSLSHTASHHNLKKSCLRSTEIRAYLDEQEIDNIFSGESHLTAIREQFKEWQT